jgi:hypothetical protein
LGVCLQEIRQSWKYYDDGDIGGGKQMIQRAEEHFDNAFSKKPMQARFIAGESGVSLGSEKGLPK